MELQLSECECLPAVVRWEFTGSAGENNFLLLFPMYPRNASPGVVIVIQIYFNTLEYEHHVESPSYTVSDTFFFFRMIKDRETQVNGK